MKQLSLNINISNSWGPGLGWFYVYRKKAEQYFTFGFGKQERAFEGYFEKKIFPENPSLTSPSLGRVVQTSQGALTTLYRGFLLYCIYCLIFAQIDKCNFQITKYICPKYKLYLPKLPMYLSKYPNIFVQITSQRGTTIPLHGISLLFPSYFSFTNCNYNLLSISLQNLFWTCFPKWWQSLFFKLKFAIQFEFAKLHRYQKVLFIEKKSLFQFRWGCDNPFVHNLGFHDYTSVWSHEVAILLLPVKTSGGASMTPSLSTKHQLSVFHFHLSLPSGKRERFFQNTALNHQKGQKKFKIQTKLPPIQAHLCLEGTIPRPASSPFGNNFRAWKIGKLII